MATYTTNKDGSITKKMASGATYTVAKNDSRYNRVKNESVSNTSAPKNASAPKSTGAGSSSSSGSSGSSSSNKSSGSSGSSKTPSTTSTTGTLRQNADGSFTRVAGAKEYDVAKTDPRYANIAKEYENSQKKNVASGASTGTLRQNADGSYTRVVGAKEYDVAKTDPRYNAIAKEYENYIKQTNKGVPAGPYDMVNAPLQGLIDDGMQEYAMPNIPFAQGENVDLFPLSAVIPDAAKANTYDMGALYAKIMQDPAKAARVDLTGLYGAIQAPDFSMPSLPDYGAQEKQYVDWAQPSYGARPSPDYYLDEEGTAQKTNEAGQSETVQSIQRILNPENFAFQNMVAGTGSQWTPTLALRQFQEGQQQNYLNQLSGALGMDIGQQQFADQFDAQQVQNQIANLADLANIEIGQNQFADQFNAAQLQNNWANKANVYGMDIDQNQWAQNFGLNQQGQNFDQWAGVQGLNQQNRGQFLDAINSLAGNMINQQNMSETQKQNNISNALRLSDMIGEILYPKSSGQSLFNQAAGQDTLGKKQMDQSQSQFDQTLQNDRYQFEQNYGQAERQMANDQAYRIMQNELGWAGLNLDALEASQRNSGKNVEATQTTNYAAIREQFAGMQNDSVRKYYFDTHKNELMTKLGPDLFMDLYKETHPESKLNSSSRNSTGGPFSGE